MNPSIRRLRDASLAIALLSTSPASGAADQCRRGERVVFSCAVANARVVSVCRSDAARPADNTLSYRFGRPGQPELVFPSTARDSLQQFRFAHYFRYQVDRAELSFATDAARYTVYDYFEGDQKPSTSRGVRVEVDGRERDLRCVGPVVSRLVELTDVVPCDADSALADCR